METRRGFLKTLGKLTAAVGLTTVAASTVEAKKSTTPSGEVDHETFMDIMETPTHPHQMKINTVPKEYAKLNAGFTGFKKSDTMAPGSLIPTENISPMLNRVFHRRNVEVNELQTKMNGLYNDMVDNIHMRAEHPQMVMSQEHYEAFMKIEQTSHLDPYDWAKTFDLKWKPFKSRPDMDVFEGMWEARVKHDFRFCFKGETFRVNVLISRHEMLHTTQQSSHARNARLISHYKENGYHKIVDELQRVIRLEAGPEVIFANPHDDPSFDELAKINGKFKGITD